MVTLRKLAPDDDLSSFDSGNRHLDRWLKKFGLGNQHLFGVTYVALDDAPTIVGFVTVAAKSVHRDRLDGTAGPSEWPVLLLARMAVARERQGRGIGKALMRHVLELAVEQHATTGCAAVVVDAKPEAVSFYEQYMFEPMRVLEGHTPGQTAMYLEIGAVLAAL